VWTVVGHVVLCFPEHIINLPHDTLGPRPACGVSLNPDDRIPA
jgi:hypothetical protein